MQMAQKPVLKNAQDFIEFFRRGGEYYDRQYLPNLMTDNRPDPHALKVLGEALLTDNDDVRDRIVRLLQEVAYLDYPAYELRTPEIIDLLIGPGFAKLDGARSDAMDLLRGRASTATLSRYGDVFLKALKEDPGGSVLLLIAKAKPEGAREEVDRLSQLPRWKDNESMRIARAAFGDTSIEDEFIAGAKQKEDAGDGIGLGEALNPLVRIGTQRSLQAVCLRMRSPLIIHRPGVQQESVRLRVMSALIYAFPEEYDLLKPSSVWEDTDYIRVEKFCTQKTGVRYDGIPRPEFFTTLPDVRAE
ncbi:MAG: hypothetical protein LBE22_03395 [Azoarcus sp.]|nr:hypothetical protein [Azoarcus sp.]